MSLFDNLLTRIGYVKKDTYGPLLQSVGEANVWNIPNPQIAENQSQLYQRLSWVNAAVSMVAQTAATTPLSVKRMSGEDEREITNHPLEVLLQRPNPKDSRYELLYATFAYHALTGNAYWWLNRTSENEPPAEIWILPSYEVKPIPDGKMFLRGYEYSPGGVQEPIILPTWQIVHFRRFHPRHWFVGLSPIESIAIVAEGDLKMQAYNTNLFAKDNAKIPGALAFADTVNNSDWERLRKEVKEQWGGVNRSGPMMMRGVGKGGIEWVQMALSQRDMEFLAGRQFTKEEIFAVYAPGLASVLDVNATEANSKAGKETFLEMAIWPALVGVAEKISNDLLPAYGDNLQVSFDDVRMRDRAMELAERQAYAQVHTVDEIRARFDADTPLGDPRGKLLPEEIGKTLLGGKEPEPIPAPLQGQPSPAQEAQTEPEAEAAEPEEDEEGAELKAMLEDLRKWQRKVAKRGKPTDFESENIPLVVHDAVRSMMAEDWRTAFDPWLKADKFDVPYTTLPDLAGEHPEEAEIDAAIETWDSLMPARYRGLLDATTEG